MRLFLFICIASLLVGANTYSQNIFKTIVKDADSAEPLPRVNIILIGTNIGVATDDSGYAEVKNIPDGNYNILFSYIGYEKKELALTFPLEAEVIEVRLEPEAEEIEEISVTSTRGSRLIDDEPTRVEVIAGEEIDEKISMDPSNISMMLNESTGIQVQQTSASSVNNSFRIQGLEGRYTQLLKDGFPLYTGFSGSLSISQILPLDLRQIEIIKGSSSTLYGGGAIAGLINLVSKIPQEEKDLSFLLNVTSALGVDASGFYSQKFGDYGLSVFVSSNTQCAYDNNDDNFSDLPGIERYTVNPKLYFYLSEKTSLEVGGALMIEDRLGGSIPLIRGDEDSVYTYTEENSTDRASSIFFFDHRFDESRSLTIKNSIGYFDREIILPDYSFSGKQVSSFTEMSYSSSSDGSDWIFGLNLLTDDFSDNSAATEKRNYSDLTSGVFVQNTLDINERVILESGLRTDYNKDYGWFILPRVSLLVKFCGSLTSRVGGGLGYKIPDIFTEDAEELAFRNVLPLNKDEVEAERSYGINFDVNYRTILFDELTFSVNQLFFYTRINDPAVLLSVETPPVVYEYSTLPGHFDTRGAETNIKFTYDHYKLFIGYTYVDARTHVGENVTEFTLTPEHRLGIVLIYEKHSDFRIGLEGYYTGRQKLSTGESTRDYWINGLMIEKRFGKISLFLNFENFLDTRQSKFGLMYTGSPSNPEFVEIYAPTDGRIINGGVKLNL
jgi:outer membrane receptor for ferrienterochelin and colicins